MIGISVACHVTSLFPLTNLKAGIWKVREKELAKDLRATVVDASRSSRSCIAASWKSHDFQT